MRFFSKNIDTIYLNKRKNYKKQIYFIELKKDKPNTDKPYFEQFDLNGKFIIKKDNSFSPKNESDYVYVKFKLKRTNRKGSLLKGAPEGNM